MVALSTASTGDRFELRGQLGAGANGVVHRVFDRVRGREVALKTLLSPGGRELYRFKREFRALADLVHPNLVALHELYTTGGEWMFTMELVDGQPFHEYVRPAPEPGRARTDGDQTSPSLGTGPLSKTLGPLDDARLRGALLQLADGLIALHGVGKLHRDVKPSNVLCERDGRVVLLDFGLIADAEAFHVDKTHERGAVGTPSYMSPEQAADRPLTDASDWYAVGVMLFEALTGRRVFEGPTEVVLRQKQRVDPPAPSALAANIPPDLDALCVALLSREPGRRPDGRAVMRALGGTPSAATDRLVEQAVRPPFVGRADELGELRRAFAESRQHGVTVVVTGGSGMGKTALVRAFLDEISVDGSVAIVEGRCYEREAVPFKALDGVIDGLTALMMTQGADELTALPPSDVAALARLFPVVRRVPGLGPAALPGVVADPLQLRRQALATLRELLEAIAHHRPLVVSIDDLQWGDQDSAAAIAELIRGPSAPRMLLVCTHRAEDVYTSEVLGPMRQAPDTDQRWVDVGAVSNAEARTLWQLLRGGTDDGEAAIRDAAGNPMLLAEIARTGRGGDQVRSVDDAVRARLGELSDDAQALLRIVAIAARPLGTDLIGRAATLGDDRAALTALRLERLVRIRGAAAPTIEPMHDRIREAVIASMTDRERRATHAAIADALAEAETPDHELLVEHCLGAGDGTTAGRHAEAAAPAAEDRLALHRAAELYGLALIHGELDDEQRSALTTRRAQTLAAAGRLLEAAVEYQAAAALVVVPRDRRALQARSVEQLLRAGQLDRGTAAAASLLRTVGTKMPSSYRRTLIALVLERLRLRWRGLAYDLRPEAQIDPALVERVDVLWSVATGFTFLNPVLVRVLATRMLRAALDAGELRRITLAFALELGYLSTGGHQSSKAVEELFARARVLTDQLEQDDVRGFVEITGGVAAYLGGRYRDARRRLDRGEQLLRDNPTEVRWQLDTCEVFQLSNLWYLGELKEVSRLHPQYLVAAIERGNFHLQRGLRGWRANVAWLIKNDIAGARAAAEAAENRRGPGEPFHLHHYYDLLAATVIDLYERRGAEAWARVDGTWKELKGSHLLRIEAVDVEAHGLRAAAALLSAGQDPSRLEIAERCAGHLESVGSPLSRVLAAQIRGAAAAERNARERAMEHLHIAMVNAEASGMAAHGMAAQLRLGQVQGGADGAARVAAAERWFRDQGVIEPKTFAGILSPALPRT